MRDDDRSGRMLCVGVWCCVLLVRDTGAGWLWLGVVSLTLFDLCHASFIPNELQILTFDCHCVVVMIRGGVVHARGSASQPADVMA